MDSPIVAPLAWHGRPSRSSTATRHGTPQRLGHRHHMVRGVAIHRDGAVRRGARHRRDHVEVTPDTVVMTVLSVVLDTVVKALFNMGTTAKEHHRDRACGHLLFLPRYRPKIDPGAVLGLQGW